MMTMKKQSNSILFILVFLLTVLPITAFLNPVSAVTFPTTPLPIPSSVTLPDFNLDLTLTADYEYSVSGGKATITKYVGSGGNIVIPSKLGGFPVTAIGQISFCFKSSILSVVFPEGLTEIGMSAFDGCTKMTSVTFPSTLTKIGLSAFEGSYALTSVILPDNLSVLGDYAFYLSGLTSAYIPKNVTSISDQTFGSCKDLAYINVSPENPAYSSVDGVLYNKAKTILIRFPLGKNTPNFIVPNTVKEIGNQAFSSNKNLASISLPVGLTKIGKSAFVGCSSLKSITIPTNVTSVGELAFRFCNSLTTVIFQGASTQIDGTAFENCYNLVNITLPSGLKTISTYTFSQCYSLKNIIIPSTVTFIGEGAFQNCYNLNSIKLPSGLKTIERSTFSKCSNLTSITIPSGVTTIGIGAFSETNLTSVVLPASITNLGIGVFNKCSNLISARFYGNAPDIIKVDGFSVANSKWFDGCAQGFKIYYLTNKTGWATPKWYSYFAEPFTATSTIPIIPIKTFAQVPLSRLSLELITPGLELFDPRLPVIPLLPKEDPELLIPDPIVEPIPLPEPEPTPLEGITTIKLYLGNSSYLVNGVNTPMDTSPLLKENRLLLPVRYVAEPLGAVTLWDSVNQKVTITSGATTIELWIGNNTAMLNGVSKLIDPDNLNVKPLLVPPGRTMLPLRFIGESLGCDVSWNQSLQEATLTNTK